jgi:hypothetical protein
MAASKSSARENPDCLFGAQARFRREAVEVPPFAYHARVDILAPRSGQPIGRPRKADVDERNALIANPRVGPHLSALRIYRNRNHADRRMPLLLRMRRVSRFASTKIRGLLRLLFVWLSAMPARATGAKLLRRY